MNKSTISLLSMLVGAGIGSAIVGKVMKKNIKSGQQLSDKHLALFKMMNQWVKVKQEGKNLSEYLKINNYQSIAIYGMSYAGKSLVDELKNTDIKIKYGIDKNFDRVYSEVNIVSMEKELEEVDAIVVTAITFFDDIAEKLEKKIGCPIISLEDILYQI